METKTCTKCGETKVLDDFYTRKGAKDGHRLDCKICRIQSSKKWTEAHPAEFKKSVQKSNKKRMPAIVAAGNKWRKDHPEQVKATRSARRAKNMPHEREVAAAWRKNNRDKCNARLAKRVAKQMQATPVWANEFFIEEAYALAKLRTEITGFEWHVDHIVPLRSKLVCGLHAENNLQVIPAVKNLSKGNRHWPDMPQQLGVHYG